MNRKAKYYCCSCYYNTETTKETDYCIIRQMFRGGAMVADMVMERKCTKYKEVENDTSKM